jgi:hypothetical protein
MRINTKALTHVIDFVMLQQVSLARTIPSPPMHVIIEAVYLRIFCGTTVTLCPPAQPVIQVREH